MNRSSRIPVTAIFDIGKTNKKFLLFNENYETVFEQQTSFKLAKDEDGDPCEDLERLVNWIGDKFNAAAADDKFDISSLNFSTYGASLVHLDEHGEPVAPLYDYLKPYPDHLEKKIYGRYGGKERFSVETASPPMGMLNSGLQLYRLKHEKSKLFGKIRHSLHFPQYLSYLFTGDIAAEYTSIGCHTGMWDFRKNDYHAWLESEGLKELLPPVQPVDTTSDVTHAGERVTTGIGIHDSSAALVPYLYLIDQPFMLISTGTWSISLNPFNSEPLTYDELRKDCLCYLSVSGDQVKAARLLLGKEYDYQLGKLKEHFDYGYNEAEVELDITMINSLVAEKHNGRKLVLETAGNSGPYPDTKNGEWKVGRFESYREGYHQLMLDLVSIQADSIELAVGGEPVDTLIVTGGFSRNDFYMKLLATRFPGKKVLRASQPHASALGAALVIDKNRGFEKGTLKELLNLKRYEPVAELDIESYSWKPFPSDRFEQPDG